MKIRFSIIILLALLLGGCQSLEYLGVPIDQGEPTITPHYITPPPLPPFFFDEERLTNPNAVSQPETTPQPGETAQSVPTATPEAQSGPPTCGPLSSLVQLPPDLGSSTVVYQHPNPFASWLALSPQGFFIFSGSDGNLAAVDPFGQLCWQVALDHPLALGPVFDPAGNIFYADDTGALVRLDSQGGLVWRFVPDAGEIAVGGPSVAADGRIFYTLQQGDHGLLQAVSPEGEGLWQVDPQMASFAQHPFITPDRNFILFGDQVFMAGDGQAVPLDLPFEYRGFRLGWDGGTYITTETSVYPVTLTPGGVIVAEDGAVLENGSFYQSRVSEDGVVLIIAFPGGDATSTTYNFNWLQRTGTAVGVSSISKPAQYGGIALVAEIDQENRVYYCGGFMYDLRESQRPYCRGVEPANDSPLWTWRYSGQPILMTGAEMIGDILYLGLEDGQLIAIRAR